MTPNREDYLKLILELGGDQKKINNKQIVSGLDVSAASVSEMISKLLKEGLSGTLSLSRRPIDRKRTSFGKCFLIRKHRLWEVFLVEHLNYSWNEVHDDAEVLEHVTSGTLADHLEAYLGHPKFCPHGGMIPEQGQPVHEGEKTTMSAYPVGTKDPDCSRVG